MANSSRGFVGHDQRGLTLVETMVSLVVFAVITVGVAPLIGSSIRGSALARSLTVGKDVAQQGMERARGLPYYVAYQAQPKKVDILDIYFPCADPTLSAANGCTGEGTRSYNSSTGVFTITCSPVHAGPSCAIPLPTGYSVTYAARFVRGDGSTLELPPSTYKRNPSSTQGALDTPPSQLVELTVTASWTFGGRSRTFQLKSLVGDRKFGPIKMAATARVGYGVQVQTAYQHDDGINDSVLTATAGASESRFVTRLVSTANQSVRAAEVTLIRQPLTPADVATTLATLRGVVSDVAAPPAAAPVPAPSPTAITTMTHPNVLRPGSILENLEVASIFTTRATGISAGVTNELPSATGGFSFDGTGGPETGIGYFWVHNHIDPTENSLLLRLDTNKKVFSLKTASSAQMSGDTRAAPTALGAGREVRAQANLDVALIRALPVNYVPDTSGVPAAERHAVIIEDFTASVDCKATSDIATSAVVLDDWSAILTVMHDPDNDGTLDDFVQASVELDSDTAVSAGGSIRAAILADGDVTLDPTGVGVAPFAPTDNPLIYDSVNPASDIYLFEEVGKLGYLTDFTINPVLSGIELGGDLVRASVDAAMQFITVPVNPARPESGFVVSVGSASCEALDQR